MIMMWIPVAVSRILSTLQTNGYSAHLVGGSVRDYLLSRTQMDFDIATSAKPEMIQHLFSKTIPTGIKHGTVTVIEDGMHCEVTTYRIDGEYDGRRPDSVDFSDSIEVDLARRDFTINAIAFNGASFIDPYGGMRDLEARLIRTVGSPDHRFREDGLRMMRAIRFSVQLQFDIEATTKRAIINNAHLISRISNERIRDELDKILVSDQPSRGIQLLKELQLLDYLIPEILEMDNKLFNSTLSIMNRSIAQRIIRIVSLLLYIPDPKLILRRLKYDRKTIYSVIHILHHKNIELSTLSDSNIKRLIQYIGLDNLQLLLELNIARQQSHSTENCKINILNVKKKIEQIVQNKEPIFMSDLVVNGDDLQQLGFQEGQTIGDILHSLLNLVIEDPSMNQKDLLLDYIKKKYM